MSQYDSEDEIRETTSEAFGVEKAARDVQQVERMFDAAKAAAGVGSLGIEATLKALSNGQVQELVISSDLDKIEYQPGRVEKILNDYAPGDDKSPVDTLPLVNEGAQVADLLIAKALNTDADVIFVDDASLLEECGGVGAVLRYNMNATANG
jgi:peptide subunit release factor 1 (eRF1)